jgi:DNA polymerase III subunit epsilon
MNFVAVDVETANADLSTICQIGVASFENGQIRAEWSSLIDPEDYFDDINIGIHGIDPRMVKGKPKLPEIAEVLRRLLNDKVTVSHTRFDRISLGQAFTKYSIPPLETSWLDSARVARRTWKDFAWKGYGLGNVCKNIGYEYKAHDALEDAKAAGHVILAAIRDTGLDLDKWQERVQQPIDPEHSSAGTAVRRDGNPEGDFFGEVVVFTGRLQIHRNEAADLAARIGCEVAVTVTKKTTMLVVGDEDVARLAGHEKSNKHLKAELLISEGQAIRLLRESDFKALVALSGKGVIPLP